MQIIKPETILWQDHVWHYQKKLLQVITGSIAFRLSNPQSLLTEHQFHTLWHQIANDYILDEGYPKTLSEVLVLGESIDASEVSIQIADIKKTLKILPERFWYPAPKFNEFLPYAPEPQLNNVALTWENAYGGKGYALNPCGKGFVKERSRLYDEHHRVALPLVEDPQHLLTSFSEQKEVAPVSLAPLSMLHPLRWRYVAAKNWQTTYSHIPQGQDVLFFQQASLDQTQTEAFKPAQAFTIKGMNASGKIHGQLPDLNLRVLVKSTNQGFQEVLARADTVWFLPNQDVGVLTFRAMLEVQDWNANDIEVLLLALDRVDAPQPVQAFYQMLQNFTGPEGYLYRSDMSMLEAKSGALAKPNAVLNAEKARGLVNEMQVHMPQALTTSTAKVIPSALVKAKILEKDSLQDEIFSHYDFSGMDFSGKTLENINFSGAKLDQTNFIGAVLKNVNFIGADLTAAKFNQARIYEALFTGTVLTFTNFSFTQFLECSFNQCSLIEVDFRHASFMGCQFFKTSWRHINALNVLMEGCLLAQGAWHQVRMRYAKLENLRVNQHRFTEVDFENSLAERNGFLGQKTSFDQCIWRACQWSNTNFLEAEFLACSFNEASFPKSEWLSARFKASDFLECDLNHNAFNDAVLIDINFTHCQLAYSNWQGAHLHKVLFENNFDYGMNLELARQVV